MVLQRSCCESNGFCRTPLGSVILALLSLFVCLLVSGVLLSEEGQDWYLFRVSMLFPGPSSALEVQKAGAGHTQDLTLHHVRAAA